MNAEQDLDRNEPATPHKLAEARKRGQTARSTELVSAVVFATAVGLLQSQGGEASRRALALVRDLLRQVPMAPRAADASRWHWHLVTAALDTAVSLAAPAIVVLCLAAALGNIAQTGLSWSWHPVQPDWSRANPAQGLRRVLSWRTLFDGLRSILKFGVLVAVGYWALVAGLPGLPALASMTPLAQGRAIGGQVADLVTALAAALALLSLLDLVYTRRQFARQMRMSRRELKDELRHREGDPRIRGRLKELRRELLKRSAALQRTAQADVVITNPTHLAVALQYEHGRMAAPVVVSKGRGATAAVIRRLAARHRVPVVRSPALARALHGAAAVDQPIPTALYADTARVIVWLLAQRRPAPQAARGSLR